MDNKTIAIISDIHGNYTALKNVLEKIEMYDDKINDIMCLGDLVGYNPEPEKCVNKIKEVCTKVIAGNHDKAIIDDLDIQWFRQTVKKSITWTKKQLSQESKSYLKALNTREDIIINGRKIILAHGSPNKNSPFSYIFNRYDIKGIEPLIMDANLLFIGHTHIPFCFCNKGEGWFQIEKDEVEINPEYNYIVNVGSVGQPRDRDPRSSFVIFNSSKNLLSFKRYEYNIKEVQDKLAETELPEEFSLRLTQGR